MSCCMTVIWQTESDAEERVKINAQLQLREVYLVIRFAFILLLLKPQCGQTGKIERLEHERPSRSALKLFNKDNKRNKQVPTLATYFWVIQKLKPLIFFFLIGEVVICYVVTPYHRNQCKFYSSIAVICPPALRSGFPFIAPTPTCDPKTFLMNGI